GARLPSAGDRGVLLRTFCFLRAPAGRDPERRVGGALTPPPLPPGPRGGGGRPPPRRPARPRPGPPAPPPPPPPPPRWGRARAAGWRGGGAMLGVGGCVRGDRGRRFFLPRPGCPPGRGQPRRALRISVAAVGHAVGLHLLRQPAERRDRGRRAHDRGRRALCPWARAQSSSRQGDHSQTNRLSRRSEATGATVVLNSGLA